MPIPSRRRILGFLCSLFIWCPGAHAQQKGDFEIKYFDLTKGRLAFSWSREPGGKDTDIYVLDFGTLKVAPLVTGPGIDEYPSWSPDGQKLVYYSEADKDREIYVIGADGTGKKRLTFSPGTDEDPDWSPDGTKIVFQTTRDRTGSQLYVMDADGSNQKRLSIAKKRSSAVNSVPRWSPRGDEILYSTNEYWPGWDIVLYNVAEKRIKVLTSGYQSFCRGNWHPNGSSFAFSYGAGDSIDIWRYEKGADSLKPLLSQPGREYDVVWNDDGSKLFFTGELTPGQGDFQIFVWDSGKDKIERVLASPGAVRYLSWTSLPTVKSLEQQVQQQQEAPAGAARSAAEPSAAEASAAGVTDSGAATAAGAGTSSPGTAEPAGQPAASTPP